MPLNPYRQGSLNGYICQYYFPSLYIGHCRMRMLPTRLIQMNLQILGHISFDCMPQQTKKANKIIHFGGLAPGSYSKISDPVLAIFLVSNTGPIFVKTKRGQGEEK